ncbi:MAG: type II toxin-antitoxin system RelE/ParE family toxin [Flavobacteriales bacterium]
MEKSDKYELKLREEAVSDIKKAHQWHSEEEPSWGEAFLNEIESAKEIITKMPKAFPNKYKDYREYCLNNYPYVIIYTLIGNKITVFSVFHTSRSPNDRYPNEV